MLVFLKSSKPETPQKSDYFSFKLATTEDICTEILALDASKVTQSDDIPAKIIRKQFWHFF